MKNMIMLLCTRNRTGDCTLRKPARSTTWSRPQYNHNRTQQHLILNEQMQSIVLRLLKSIRSLDATVIAPLLYTLHTIPLTPLLFGPYHKIPAPSAPTPWLWGESAAMCCCWKRGISADDHGLQISPSFFLDLTRLLGTPRPRRSRLLLAR